MCHSPFAGRLKKEGLPLTGKPFLFYTFINYFGVGGCCGGIILIVFTIASINGLY